MIPKLCIGERTPRGCYVGRIPFVVHPGLLMTRVEMTLDCRASPLIGHPCTPGFLSFLPFFFPLETREIWMVFRWSLPLSHLSTQSRHCQNVGNYSESHHLQEDSLFGSRLRLPQPCKQRAVFAQCCLSPVIPMGPMPEQHRQLSWSVHR